MGASPIVLLDALLATQFPEFSPNAISRATRASRSCAGSPRTQRSKSAANRGPLYFAWGCFRDFCSGAPMYRRRDAMHQALIDHRVIRRQLLLAQHGLGRADHD